MTPEEFREEVSYTQRWVPGFLHFLRVLKVTSKEMAEPGPITPYEAQLRFLRELDIGLTADQHFFVVLKSRQLGISTIMLALDIFWLFMFPGLRGALIADNDENRDAFRDTITEMLDSLPFGFAIPYKRNNRKALTLQNGSTLYYLAAGKGKNPDLGRSKGLSFVHGTEVATWGDQDGLRSLIDALAVTNPNRLYVFESTARGFNTFNSMYEEAKRSPDQRAIFIGWWAKHLNRIAASHVEFQRWWGANPVLTEQETAMSLLIEQDYGVTLQPEQWAWWRYQLSTRTLQNLLQEHPWHESVAWQQTGSSFFNIERINGDISLLRQGLVTYDGYRYELGDKFITMRCDKVMDAAMADLKIYEAPVRNARYAIGVDVAFGRSATNDRHCLDEETEILTSDGWKGLDEVAVGDEAVCFDLGTKAYVYGAVSDKIVRRYEGRMLHFGGKAVDHLVTPEHRVVQRNSHNLRGGGDPKWNFRTAQQMWEYGKFIRRFPIGGAPIGSGVAGLSLETCRALGWILTDGHISRTPSTAKGLRKSRAPRAAIVIVQATSSEKAGKNISEKMLSGLKSLCPNLTARRYNPKQEGHSPGISIRIGVQEAEQFMHWLEPDDGCRIPREILLHGSLAQLGALFEGILDGDGGWDKRRQEWTKVCPGNNSAFADDVQEVAMRLGYSATKAVQKATAIGGAQWLVRLAGRKTHVITKKAMSEREYDGRVWCVTVPTGAFVCRRNGKTFVTGNCITVFRCFADKMVQAAEWTTSLPETFQVAWVLAHLAGSYRDNMINLETNGPGIEIITQMRLIRQDIEFSHLVPGLTPTFDARRALDQARWYIFHRPDTPGAGYLLNWRTNADNKQQMFAGFRDAYSTNQLIIRSAALLDEMMTLRQNGQSIGAQIGKKDDRPFAAGLACHAWRDWIRLNMLQQGRTYEVEMRKQADVERAGGRVIEGIVPQWFAQQERLRNEARRAELLGDYQ